MFEYSSDLVWRFDGATAMMQRLLDCLSSTMHISKLSLKNFKTFHNKQILGFDRGFNVLVGSNNSGKTSVLDALDLNISLDSPHRSAATVKVHGGTAPGHSLFSAEISTDFSELALIEGNALWLPIRRPNVHAPDELTAAVVLHIEKKTPINVEFEFGAGKISTSFDIDAVFAGKISNGITYGAQIFSWAPSPSQATVYEVGSGADSGLLNQTQLVRSRIYRFNAQRRPLYECAASTQELDRDATNLAYCINHIQTNDAHGHKQLCEWIERIFPSIKWVQSPPDTRGVYQLRCLPTRPEERRDDLAIPMSSVGSGLGNVLAMLYVVMTCRHPQVIAIDEPNAYLHPRALRELLAILSNEGSQHQFILTAHSADVLTAVTPRTISILDFDSVGTTVTQVGPAKLHEVMGSLGELGIRVTDLHSKDAILWVEGHTEELVLPALLRFACPEKAAGTGVLRVETTGAFSKKRGLSPDEIVRIYERLSNSSSLVPPMVCVLLDAEGRPATKLRELERAANGKLRFLPRRMLENYVLHAGAIARALNELGESVDLESISAALILELTANPDWEKVDGAAVLRRLFEKFSGPGQEFRKTRDVPTIIETLLDVDPGFLNPLRDFLRTLFNLVAR